MNGYGFVFIDFKKKEGSQLDLHVCMMHVCLNICLGELISRLAELVLMLFSA